jgi:hypothetical protein
MKRLSAITFGLIIVGCMNGPLSPLASGQTGEGWTTLFDGSNLEGWNMIGDANWELADDDSVGADSGNGFLVTAGSYGDFELRLEFWVDEPANSGVFIRCTDPGNISPASAYEVNIFDTRADQTYRTGGIVNVAAPESVINTGGQWNTYEIRADGSRLVVTLNGIRTVDVEHDGFAAGAIGLQYGAGIVKFRNVAIRTL